MQVRKLSWSHFRNLSGGELLPNEGMNVICGENAQGKTNIIEAIWLFSGAKSFRTLKDSAFIEKGFDFGKTELTFLADGIEKQAKIEFREKRQAFLNEKPLSGPAKLAGIFNTVIFSPADLALIQGAPEERRKFLDLAIGQLYPAYIVLLHRYKKALLQRNKTLKDYKYDGSLTVMLDIFEEELAQVGAEIINRRIAFLQKMKDFLPNLYAQLSGGKEKLTFSYRESCSPELLARRLAQGRQEDMLLGSTSVGPHRDDILFQINEFSVRNYGSQGQQRSVDLSLKLAQAEIIFQQTGEYPVCLLDDVMSELDPTRQNFVLNHICRHQCFLTCCDPANINGLQNGKIFQMEKGTVTA
ncbi:MAG: DNA replication/repair protein RecF [Clostridia bacterium]|nr:DNA replication/repair protein RecF [Clostridia bacterium]